mmetsp:Transcript_5311/g.4904  ORF Transcript_5311/g.4904 Transcript_5311/m.4904 type:complete len:124 (-) Transcript_5311:204-575(-)
MESKKSKGIVVDEGGNKREVITSEDIRQALTDLSEWFKINASSYYSEALKNNSGVGSGELSPLMSKFGVEGSIGLVELYSKFNGGFHFRDTFKGISLSKVLDLDNTLKLSQKKLFPIALDIDE